MLNTSVTHRNYLLLPSHPTPNGRLHLGHIAGPYLKMDVLRRALQRRGHSAVLMFAVDSYESYVLLRAHELNAEPAEVASRYSREIREDLAALDIQVDHFFDPLADLARIPYRDSVINRVESLRRRSGVEEHTENFLYSAGPSRFIVGCWLLGECPNCGQESGGYSCEACACHYRPEELRKRRSRLDEGALSTVTCKTLFLRVKNEALLRYRIEQMLPPPFQEILTRYLARSGAILRISVPGTWGVPIAVAGEPWPQVVYSGFASLGLLDACGREYAQRFAKGNPFYSGSDVAVTCSFGIDNTVSRVLSCVGGALDDESFRPPDSFLLNYFYQLEGAKFSTSRNHAIWASAIGSLSPTMSDTVRFYLLETSPEESETGFRVSSFLTTANELNDNWNPVIARALSNIVPSTAPGAVIQAIEDTLARQDECLDVHSFRSRALPAGLRRWIEIGRSWSSEFPYWWLKGFAVLAWPVLPRISSALWSHLGHDGAPTLHSFLETPSVRGGPLQLFQPVSLSDLQGCLPDSVRSPG